MSVLVGLLCGLIVWLVLDPLQSRALGEIFQKELQQQLEQRARDSRHRFQQYLGQWRLTATGLAQNWRLVEYVKSPAWAQDREKPKTYLNRLPDWMAPAPVSLGAVTPSQIVLLDQDLEPREIFHRQDLPFPLERAASRYPGGDGALLTTLWKAPFLLVWAGVAQPVESKAAILMLIIPLDTIFLLNSQQAVADDETVVALLEGDQQRILASSDQTKVTANMLLEQLRSRYLITSQSITDFADWDQNVQFSTFVSRKRVEATAERILSTERRERFLGALAFVGVFSLLFFLVSMRLHRLLNRIASFGRRALGINQPVSEKGNQLLLLEAWIPDFFALVSEAVEQARLRHELQIRESEALKSALLDSSLDSIVTVDCSGMVVETNGTAERTFGYTREQMLGESLGVKLFHPDDRQQFGKLLQRYNQSAELVAASAPLQLRAFDAQGDEMPVETVVMPILLEHTTLFTVYIRDISARRRAEREIESLATFASDNPSPVLRVNRRGVITYANAASAPLLAYWSLEPQQTLPLYWRNLVLETLEEGGVREIELSGDEQIFSLLLAPFSEQEYVHIYGRDITQVRNAEQQSRQHQSELVHVCRVSTMGEMATGLAHELNQPLAAIVNFASGCVRRLQAGIGGEAELVDAMAQITVQAERAGEIIKRLRSLVGKNASEQTLVNLNDLVIEVASFIEYDAAKKGVDVRLALEQGGLPVRVDLVQIEQVLLNLMRNAMDAMQQTEADQRILVLSTSRLNVREVAVMISDTGPGIPPEVMEKLFDPFFSTKQSGMGMGLAISYRIIEDHNGSIRVTSEKGKGTLFSVQLPSNPDLKLPGL
jgi:PAS domain S-box-containing protein